MIPFTPVLQLWDLEKRGKRRSYKQKIYREGEKWKRKIRDKVRKLLENKNLAPKQSCKKWTSHSSVLRPSSRKHTTLHNIPKDKHIQSMKGRQFLIWKKKAMMLTIVDTDSHFMTHKTQQQVRAGSQTQVYLIPNFMFFKSYQMSPRYPCDLVPNTILGKWVFQWEGTITLNQLAGNPHCQSLSNQEKVHWGHFLSIECPYVWGFFP